MRVGFVGLGDIGAPMARRLAERFPVLVWARRPEATKGFVDVAADLTELAGCDVVGVCVDDDDALRDVVGRLATVARPGTVVCAHSTVRPETVRDLGDHLIQVGAGIVDAPVSGGSDGAARGELLVLAGGQPDDLERCRPVLEALGSVHVVGPVGAAQTAKLLNNALYTAHAALGVTALDLGERLGLSRSELATAVLAGSGGSFAFGRLDRLLEPGAAGHIGRMLEKDLDLFDHISGPDGAAIASVGRPLIDRLRGVARA